MSISNPFNASEETKYVIRSQINRYLGTVIRDTNINIAYLFSFNKSLWTKSLWG